jgi:hypothetical protein
VPLTVLDIKENGQNEKHRDAGQNALTIHERENSAPPSLNAKWETAIPR